jgi:tetratricopeptide (TPR) repeat protein
VSGRGQAAEATPLLDATTLASLVASTRGAAPPGPGEPLLAPPPGRPPTGRPPRGAGLGRRQALLASIAGAAVAVFAALGPDSEPAPLPRPAAGLRGEPVAAAARLEPSPGAGAPAARGSGPPPRGPAPRRGGRRPRLPAPEHAARPAAAASQYASTAAAAAAVEAYLAGDLAEARRALAGVDEGEGAMALAFRLEAIALLLGPAGQWPPPGGAAALERLLELDRALELARPSPLALRAGAELADRHAAKAQRLADEGRWEESLAAAEAALARKADHEPARRALARLEAVAEATYLEGYAVEEVDPDAARRLYARAARLAPAGSDLAGRVAARLSAPAPRGGAGR